MLLQKKFLPQYSNNRVKVFIVNAKYMQNDHMPDFVGGHALVMSKIPSGEVWIADDLKEDEQKRTIYYLLCQKRLMAMGLPYGDSVKRAEKLEHDSKGNYDSAIQGELQKAVFIIEPTISNGVKHKFTHRDKAEKHFKTLHDAQKKRRSKYMKQRKQANILHILH